MGLDGPPAAPQAPVVIPRALSPVPRECASSPLKVVEQEREAKLPATPLEVDAWAIANVAALTALTNCGQASTRRLVSEALAHLTSTHSLRVLFLQYKVCACGCVRHCAYVRASSPALAWHRRAASLIFS
ncbi:MAG: hypothetical protein EOO41_04025 [Methanobacteriota archaeon]|nr:MAG: hypothetical protein EOO41_04025 [Euryarchaeota archaeon]